MKSDAQIRQDVLSELKGDPEIDEADVGVTVRNGAATLTGYVPTCHQKRAAIDAVKRVTDVKAVVDTIDVRLRVK